MTRAQLAHVEWEFIDPYLPIGEYGPYPVRLRQQFEGVPWRFRTGGQWRGMPGHGGCGGRSGGGCDGRRGWACARCRRRSGAGSPARRAEHEDIAPVTRLQLPCHTSICSKMCGYDTMSSGDSATMRWNSGLPNAVASASVDSQTATFIRS